VTILFLDFDGVLHPESAGSDELLSRRHYIWSILGVCPAVNIVFSTTWRHRSTVDALVKLVTAGGGEHLSARFLGATPELIRPGGKPLADLYRHRELECLAWLDGNSVRDPWMALDDATYFFTFGSPHLFAVDYTTGLTSDDVQKIKTILNGLSSVEL
jgi:hypothetical protein